MACQNWISVRCCATDGAASPPSWPAPSSPPTECPFCPRPCCPPFLTSAPRRTARDPLQKPLGAEQVAHQVTSSQPSSCSTSRPVKRRRIEPRALVVLGVLGAGDADGLRARGRRPGQLPASAAPSVAARAGVCQRGRRCCGQLSCRQRRRVSTTCGLAALASAPRPGVGGHERQRERRRDLCTQRRGRRRRGQRSSAGAMPASPGAAAIRRPPASTEQPMPTQAPVRHRHAADRDLFHLPQMRELVVAAAGRSRVAVRLHGEPRHDQARASGRRGRRVSRAPHAGRLS